MNFQDESAEHITLKYMYTFKLNKYYNTILKTSLKRCNLLNNQF